MKDRDGNVIVCNYYLAHYFRFVLDNTQNAHTLTNTNFKKRSIISVLNTIVLSIPFPKGHFSIFNKTRFENLRTRFKRTDTFSGGGRGMGD